MDFDLSGNFAQYLDENDPLAKYRACFSIPDQNLIYLDGNSLGRQTNASEDRLQQLNFEWKNDLIRGYNKNWWHAPSRVGEKIAQLVGAAPDQTLVCDTVSVNLFKLAAAALRVKQQRRKIVTDTLNFPSDLYILQGLAHLLGDRHEIIRIGSNDGDITPDISALEKVIDQDTALVTLSHVTFKSGYLYDMDAITRLAHNCGAFILWDLSHSVGAVPIKLDACDVDFAIGCTYKYLNGGPGSPAFLYVKNNLQELLSSPIWGWWGQFEPFAFHLEYVPAMGIMRFLTGSQPILSLLVMEAALDPLLEAGVAALRDKSIRMSEYFIYLTEQKLVPLGFSLASPRNAEHRGSHISLHHPEGYRINRALIEEMKVIPDFREPDNLRFGLTPLYTTYWDIWEGIERIRKVILEERYHKYVSERLTVT